MTGQPRARCGRAISPWTERGAPKTTATEASRFHRSTLHHARPARNCPAQVCGRTPGRIKPKQCFRTHPGESRPMVPVICPSGGTLFSTFVPVWWEVTRHISFWKDSGRPFMRWIRLWIDGKINAPVRICPAQRVHGQGGIREKPRSVDPVCPFLGGSRGCADSETEIGVCACNLAVEGGSRRNITRR